LGASLRARPVPIHLATTVKFKQCFGDPSARQIRLGEIPEILTTVLDFFNHPFGLR
jgi:hypothetical protein